MSMPSPAGPFHSEMTIEAPPIDSRVKTDPICQTVAHSPLRLLQRGGGVHIEHQCSDCQAEQHEGEELAGALNNRIRLMERHGAPLRSRQVFHDFGGIAAEGHSPLALDLGWRAATNCYRPDISSLIRVSHAAKSRLE